MILYDYECVCGEKREELVRNVEEVVTCQKCGKPMERVFAGTAKTIVTYIPMYPGSLRHKAGYTHTRHAAHPATRIQSGFGGSQSPKD